MVHPISQAIAPGCIGAVWQTNAEGFVNPHCSPANTWPIWGNSTVQSREAPEKLTERLKVAIASFNQNDSYKVTQIKIKIDALAGCSAGYSLRKKPRIPGCYKQLT
jgi:hypothetical protein